MIGSVVFGLAVAEARALQDTLGQQLDGDGSLLDCGVDLRVVEECVFAWSKVWRAHEFDAACRIAFTTGLELGIRAARIEARPLPDRRIIL